jgi:CBS-domain-containing membrane protein
MNALDLITPGLAPLKAETLCEDALMYLNHWNIGNLPVVVDGKPLGLIHSSDLALASPKDAIKGLVKTEVSFLIFQGAHIFDVLKVLGESAHHALAVLNEKGEVVGVVSPGQALFGKMQKFNAILKGNVPVGMVSLQMRYQDYFLSEIARIAESNNCKSKPS